MVVVKVEGEKRKHKVFIYTLSTCGWCKKTKEFLKEEGIEYEPRQMIRDSIRIAETSSSPRFTRPREKPFSSCSVAIQ